MKLAPCQIGTRLRTRAIPMLLGMLAAASTTPAGAQSTPQGAALKGSPCTVLTLSEVQTLLPGAKAGQLNRPLADAGIAECDYGNPGGNVLSVIETYSSSSTNARQAALDWAESMNVDPSNPYKKNSLKNVRIESFPGLGVDVAVLVEKADPARGILRDTGCMVLRRGNHELLIATDQPRPDRAVALKVFEEVGRVAARRLQ
jgi:hypothetical protein